MSADVVNRGPEPLRLDLNQLPPSPPRSPLSDDDDDSNISPDLDDGVDDQDEAQSVMCPVMSLTASHLTSLKTPALEKAAAMEKLPTGGLFGMLMVDEDDDDEDDGSKTRTTSSPMSPKRGSPLKVQSPTATSPKESTGSRLPPSHIDPRRQMSLPSPWSSGPKDMVIDKNKDGQSRQSRFRPSMNYLNNAFGPTRQRSRSAGQDALKKLQKAFPSLTMPTHYLPSLSTNFFSSFSEKSSPTSSTRPSLSQGQSPNSSASSVPQKPTGSGARLGHGQSTVSFSPSGPSTSMQSPPSAPSPRPKVLRRVTSDESILYHSLSRASSLGNDEEFNHVREMVNMRLQAIRESLPDVPNLKMPSLPKFHTPSFISMPSISNDSTGAATPRPCSVNVEKEMNIPKPQTELDRILEDLTGDIVIMGGLRGSVLRSAKSPHQQVWAPVKVGLNMRKVNLEIGLDDEDEERVEETIIPSGMLTHMGPVDMSRKLLKKLRHCENARTGKLRVWNYGYDWRLSPHILSRKLQDFLAKLPSNQPGVPPESRGALVIAHSMGGLITRHAVNQKPDLFSGVLFAGTPQRCINILGPLRHGDVIMFNEKLLSTKVNFSLRSYFVFLPEDGFCFVNKNTREEFPVNFFDANAWVKGAISPCVAPVLPAYNRSATGSSGSPSLSSLLPNSLRARAASQTDKWFGGSEPMSMSPIETKDRTIAPQINSGKESSTDPSSDSAPIICDADRTRNIEYLARTLARTKQFRAELAHIPTYRSSNAYPPFAVLYGKSTPTVYGAHVTSRDAIPCADAYDDLLFRPGDGVVLAKEAMLPEGYGVVKGGRVCTERGHITMLADLNAVGQAVGALIRGRRKGIGLRDVRQGSA